MTTTTKTELRYAIGDRVQLPAGRVDPGGDLVEGLTGSVVGTEVDGGFVEEGGTPGPYYLVEVDGQYGGRLIYAESELARAWRTYHGAQYDCVREVPCRVIANRYLIDDNGDPVGEDHPALAAEIERRGRHTYRDHGYGDGHYAPGWGAIAIAGCDHR